jgi:hypothetical protein
MITLTELERRVISAAIYAVCGSGSITAQCRSDAAVLVLVWARASGKTQFDADDIDAKTEQAYRYFEFGDSFGEPEPEWAIWDDPSPSASTSPSA